MTSKAPELVSVLIPAYNAEATVAAAIQSVLDQTWPRIEIIVVDDGSRDRTHAVAKAFESKSVKVVSERNMGAPAARNAAFQLAQGDYIQWLDADDLLDREKIGAQMRVAKEMSNPRVLLSGAFGTFYYRPEKAVFTQTSLWRDLQRVEYFLTRFNENVYFQTGAWLVSRELSDFAGPWTVSDSPDDDGEYFCRIALHSAGVKFVAQARSYYRVANLSSVSQSRSQEALTALYWSKAKCIEYLLSVEDSARTRHASVRLLQDWLPHFYPHREDLVARARQLAAELGGELHRPSVKWKYRPVEWVCGYETAVSASRILPRFRSQALRRWDEWCHQMSEAREHSAMPR